MQVALDLGQRSEFSVLSLLKWAAQVPALGGLGNDRLHFRGREKGRQEAGRAGLLDRGHPQEQRHGGQGWGDGPGQARLGVPKHPLEREKLTRRHGPREMGTCLEGKFSPEVCKGLFHSSGCRSTALIEVLQAWAPPAPTATPRAAARESYLGEAEEAGESKFSII